MVAYLLWPCDHWESLASRWRHTLQKVQGILTLTVSIDVLNVKLQSCLQIRSHITQATDCKAKSMPVAV